MREERVVRREVDPVADLERRCFRLCALEGDGPMRGADLLDASESREEVEVPVAAAQLAVRHGMEAGGLFLRDEVADGRVLGRSERRSGDLAARGGGALLFERRRAQEAADDVIAEGGIFLCCHEDRFFLSVT